MEVSTFHDRLGRLLDGNPRHLIRLANLETRWHRHRISEMRIDRPVYICGLARSGSTILLEMLASHPAAVTHKYRDFPLIHVPLWWNWFIDQAQGGGTEAVERAHRDGIHVTLDSPEAMEEILWMAFFRNCHDPSTNNVVAGIDNPGFAGFYRDHIRKLLILREGYRYVSKGNYNLARLRYIQNLFPDARFVIPVREPITHVASLVKQDRLFSRAERENPKVLDYMRRAGHYEFGLDKRPLNLGNGDTVRDIQRLWAEGLEAQGYARYWAYVYGYVADLLERDKSLAHRTILVPYEELCESPEMWLENIHAHCELETDRQSIAELAQGIAAPTYYRHGFSDAECNAISNVTCDAKGRMARLCREQCSTFARRSAPRTDSLAAEATSGGGAGRAAIPL